MRTEQPTECFIPPKKLGMRPRVGGGGGGGGGALAGQLCTNAEQKTIINGTFSSWTVRSAVII